MGDRYQESAGERIISGKAVTIVKLGKKPEDCELIRFVGTQNEEEAEEVKNEILENFCSRCILNCMWKIVRAGKISTATVIFEAPGVDTNTCRILANFFSIKSDKVIIV